MEKVLFPDRGVKIENGRVYQPLAFGSTRPRNMMPGHLASSVDARTMTNLKGRHKRQRKIAKLRTAAAAKQNEVYKLMAELKKGRTDYLAGVQLKKFHEAIKQLESSEHSLRPSDKTGALRDYGLLDKDLWGLSELRGWFNKNPPPQRTYDAFAGGATIRGPTPRAARRAQSARAGPRHPHRFTTPRTAHRLPPAGVYPGQVVKPKHHWSNYEDNVKVEKMTASQRLRLAKLPATLPRPWKDRPMEDEGYMPDPSVYAREEKMKWNQSDMHLKHQLMKERAMRMQGGTKNLLHHL